MDNILPLIQTSLLTNLRTNNVIIDSILSVVLVILISKLSFNYFTVVNWMKTLFRRKNKKKSEYLIQGKVTTSNDLCLHSTNFPSEYKAIMYKLHTLKIDIMYGKQFNNKNRYDCYDSSDKKTVDNFSYSLNSSTEIKVTDDILVCQLNDIDKSTDLKSSTETYNMYVYSYTLPFTELKEIINEWNIGYNKYLKEHNDGNCYYFTYIGPGKKTKDETDSENKVFFESHVFKSNKTFHNTIFEQKDEVVERLEYFLTHEKRYKELGIPHTLGLMFYGYPGCGKTSCIKAIANYTQRHIVEISLSKIKTCGELRKVFLNEMINGFYVPSNRKIIVLEDIDCMGDLVKHRKNTLPKQDNTTKVNESKVNESKVNESKVDDDSDIDTDSSVYSGDDGDFSINPHANISSKKLMNRMFKYSSKYHDDDELTFSYFLNIIDGILEQPGRIMIVTTNKPNSIDHAFTRPGRIDLKIEFKKCNRVIIRAIIKLYFGKDVSVEFPEYKYTQAEIFELCFNLNDIGKVCAVIMEQ